MKFLLLLLSITANAQTFDSITVEGDTTLQGLSGSTVPYLDSGKILNSSAVTPTQLNLLTKVGSANGIASLDGSGKVPISEMPVSALIYRGNWNAMTNVPFLVDGVGTQGDVWEVVVAGTHDFGSGPIAFSVGDFVIYDGFVWQRTTANSVVSVNGAQGIVTLTTDNIPQGSSNFYYSNALTIGSLLSSYASTTGTVNSSDSILSAIEKIDGNQQAAVTGVSSVSNSDGTMTISPTTGAVVASRAAITGDIAIGSGSNSSTLATVNSSPGTYSPASVTVNGKGLVTSASNVTTGNFTDVGTDGISVTGGSSAVLGSGTSISQHVAGSSNNGYLSSSDWTTFNSKQSALTFSTPLVNTAGTISCNVASGSQAGCIASSDWNTFNGKQSSLTFANSIQNTAGTINLVGDSTSPGNSYYYGTNGSGTKGFYTLPAAPTYSFSTGLTNTAGTITNNLSTGISGNQTAVGSTSSTGNLILSSTTNATKGQIQLDSQMTWLSTLGAITHILGPVDQALNISSQVPSSGNGNGISLISSNGATSGNGGSITNTTGNGVGTSKNGGNWSLSLGTATSGGTSGQVSISQTLSGSDSSTAFSLTPTWNTSGTPTAFKLNVTDSASNSASLLIDLQTGGTSKFNVNKSGNLTSIGSAQFNGGLSNNGSNPSLGNFNVPNNQSISSSNGAQFQLSSSTNMNARSFFFGQSSTLIGVNNSHGSVVIGRAPVTTPASGVNPVLANLAITPLGTVTLGGSTVTNTASLYIDGAGLGGTNNYAVMVNSGDVFFGGNEIIGTAGKGLQIKSGLNAKIGTATCAGVPIVVSNTSVTANSQIYLTIQTPGGTVNGAPYITSVTPTTGFSITCSNALDTSTIGYMIVEKN